MKRIRFQRTVFFGLAAAAVMAVSGCGERFSASSRPDGQAPLFEAPKEANPISLAMSQAFLNRGSQLFEAGNYYAAVQSLGDALAADPHNAMIYYLRAGAHLRLQQVPEAVADLSQAIETDGQPQYFLSRCGAYFMTGELDAAISDCTETIRRTPTESDAYFLRALTYLSKGEFESALADALTILMIRRNDPNARQLVDEILAAREAGERGQPTTPEIKTDLSDGM